MRLRLALAALAAAAAVAGPLAHSGLALVSAPQVRGADVVGGADAGQRKDTATPMGAFRRLADIIRAKVNKLLDRVEDPRDSLDLSYEKQVENL